MPFFGRGTRGPGRFLQWKIRLLAVGAVLLLVGMAREMDLLVILSIAVLAAAFALRFFEREAPEEAPAEDEEYEAERWSSHRRETGADGDTGRRAE